MADPDELLAKAAELRAEADRMFDELAAHASGLSRPGRQWPLVSSSWMAITIS
jgi:hypothetical protein